MDEKVKCWQNTISPAVFAENTIRRIVGGMPFK